MKNTLNLLKHLQFLTGSFEGGKKIYFIKVYSREKNNIFVPLEAAGEGISCVDDTARAALLALEIFEFFGEKGALDWAKKWLSFLGYMKDENGYITNFIENNSGKRVYDKPSSYKGGPWWSARSKWAWAKAYKLTHNKVYLDLYFGTEIKEQYENDVAGILLLAALEIWDRENIKYIKGLIERISSFSIDGYLAHSKDTPLHLWGYHELEALAKTSAKLNNAKLLNICRQTISSLVEEVVNEGFYYEFFTKDKSEINPYCISPIFRGLYEVYHLENNKKYKVLMRKCLLWLKKIYNPQNGRCFDGISDGRISKDCGAEASVEAGFCWIRGLKLGLV